MKNNQSNLNNSHSKYPKYLTSLSLVVFGIGIGVGGIYAINSPQLITENLKNLTQSQPANAQSELALVTPADSGNFVTDVVNKVGPAVVRINASRTVKTEDPSMSNDPFFGSQVPQMPDTQIQRGTGSGFIVSNDGKILTNAHVVDGADQVTVTLKDGRTLTGKVLGEDTVTDVAVIKIEAENLPTIKIGNSDKLQVGEWAIAIGNPLGLDNTVTTGIISATGRLSSQVGVGDKRVEFLQTDAAINPGNSGGPLLNAQGEVIGMNTAIIKDAQGIGFAIPINKAQQISSQLIATGKADHPYLGIQMVGITPEIKQELQQRQGLTIKADNGVLIMNVASNSPADKAGLKPGDVLQEINQQPLKDPGAVQQKVEKTSIGQTLPVKVERDGQSLTLEVTVGVLPTN